MAKLNIAKTLSDLRSAGSDYINSENNTLKNVLSIVDNLFGTGTLTIDQLVENPNFPSICSHNNEIGGLFKTDDSQIFIPLTEDGMDLIDISLIEGKEGSYYSVRYIGELAIPIGSEDDPVLVYIPALFNTAVKNVELSFKKPATRASVFLPPNWAVNTSFGSEATVLTLTETGKGGLTVTAQSNDVVFSFRMGKKNRDKVDIRVGSLLATDLEKQTLSIVGKDNKLVVIAANGGTGLDINNAEYTLDQVFEVRDVDFVGDFLTFANGTDDTRFWAYGSLKRFSNSVAPMKIAKAIGVVDKFTIIDEKSYPVVSTYLPHHKEYNKLVKKVTDLQIAVNAE